LIQAEPEGSEEMADIKAIIEQAYSAFNKCDIDRALPLMTSDVSWPKASEGGRVVGKEEIRAYWARQWTEFDPHVWFAKLKQGRKDWWLSYL
jgi:ketosteroid isomerase-like protein